MSETSNDNDSESLEESLLEENSNSKGYEIKQEENDLTCPRWKHQKVFELESWCLNDHPEFWKHAGIKVELILNNPRLSKSRGQPKNNIISLPDPDSVTLQFYCSNCSAIPFPWVSIPNSKMSSEEVSAEVVHLCHRGHAICRACYNTYTHCVFDAVDFNYVFQKDKEKEERVFHNIPESIEGSLGLWGQRHMCLAELCLFQCMFLKNMIMTTEFACKFFYNWCRFRGVGKQLRIHEVNCSFVNALESNGKQCFQDTNPNCLEPSEVNISQQEKNSTDEDEEQILTLDVSNMCKQARVDLLLLKHTSI